MKRCPKCGRILPKANFAINRAHKDGLACYCKECHNKLQNESRARKRMELRAAMSAVPTVPVASVPTEIPSAMEKRVVLTNETATGLEGFKSVLLIEELRRRGYRGKLEITREVRV